LKKRQKVEEMPKAMPSSLVRQALTHWQWPHGTIWELRKNELTIQDTRGLRLSSIGGSMLGARFEQLRG
jgi:hypothetical protein